jgi:hypothetical protein
MRPMGVRHVLGLGRGLATPRDAAMGGDPPALEKGSTVVAVSRASTRWWTSWYGTL